MQSVPPTKKGWEPGALDIANQIGFKDQFDKKWTCSFEKLIIIQVQSTKGKNHKMLRYVKICVKQKNTNQGKAIFFRISSECIIKK